MCIGFWSLSHPDYSLVLCTNRDEYLSRPTDPAHWHSFESLHASEHISSNPGNQEAGARILSHDGFVLSGIDRVAGGTWFGINRAGDISLATNITEPTSKLTSSRGHLCSSFLKRDLHKSQRQTLDQFAEQLTSSGTRYAGFNMLLLSPAHIPNSATDNVEDYTVEYEAVILSNGGSGKPIRRISSSKSSGNCSCLTNDTMTGIDAFTGLMTDAEWPKAVLGRDLFSNIISQHEVEAVDVLVERLFGMLRTKTHLPPTNRQGFQETIMVDVLDMLNVRGGASFVQTNRPSDEIPNRAETSDGMNVRSDANISRHESALGDDHPTSTIPKYYGTRLATVLLVRRDGKVLFIERDVWINDKDNSPVLVDHERQRDTERRYSFQIG